MTDRPIYESNYDSGWSEVPLLYKGVLCEVHVLPESDLRKHVMGPDCWCEPVMDADMLVHNSADQRELYERGERLPH